MSVPTSTYSLSHAVSSFTPGYTPTSSPSPGSPPPEPEYDILIYGSTSFTGKLVISYLVRHPQSRSFTYALAGRTQSKLDDLARKVEEEGYERPPIVCFSLEEGEEGEKAVREAVGRCKVVVNLAGPFSTQNAEMLIRCVFPGSHHRRCKLAYALPGRYIHLYSQAMCETRKTLCRSDRTSPPSSCYKVYGQILAADSSPGVLVMTGRTTLGEGDDREVRPPSTLPTRR